MIEYGLFHRNRFVSNGSHGFHRYNFLPPHPTENRTENGLFHQNLFRLQWITSISTPLHIYTSDFPIEGKGIRLESGHQYWTTSFSYENEFRKCGIREVQRLFQSNAWYKQWYLSEETENRWHNRNTQLKWVLNVFPGKLQLCLVSFHVIMYFYWLYFELARS